MGMKSSHEVPTALSGSSMFDGDDGSAMEALRRVSFHSRVANSDHKDMSEPPTPSQGDSFSERSDSQSELFASLQSAAAKQKTGGLYTPPRKSNIDNVITIDTDTSEDVQMRTQSFGRMNRPDSTRSRSRSPPFSGGSKPPLAPSGAASSSGGGMDLMAKLKAAAAAQAAAKNK